MGRHKARSIEKENEFHVRPAFRAVCVELISVVHNNLQANSITTRMNGI